MKRTNKCPQCGSATIQPRDSQDYCEECGWPEENRTPEFIKKGTFLLVGHGECFNSEVVSGGVLLKHLREMVVGDDSSPCEMIEMIFEELENEDNWGYDSDCGPTWFKTDLGEIDHIEVIRITEPVKAVGKE